MAPKLESMTVTPAKNKGFVVRHHYTPKTSVSRGRNGGGFMISPQSEEHVFGENEHDAMLSHIKKTLGMKQDRPAEE